jgi:4-hydroxybenzoate polyprenyltransferase
MMGVLGKVVDYGRMIKFSHTVFALPFALSAVVLAQREVPLTWAPLAWVLVALVAARSAAMGFNRIVDAQLDARNPRTAGREIPAGTLGRRQAGWFVAASSLVFVAAAAMLGRLCLWLSVPVLVVLCGYSYTKRFTWLSHLVLGLAISLAPLGAWIALTGRVQWPILLLSGALLTYIAGFDIIYACQDADYDRGAGLHSIPARFGLRRALWVSTGLHGVSFLFFLLIHFAFDMHPVYLATVAVIGILLVVEHRLVDPGDLSRVQVAFFHVNSLISVVLLAGVLLDEVLRRWNG